MKIGFATLHIWIAHVFITSQKNFVQCDTNQYSRGLQDPGTTDLQSKLDQLQLDLKKKDDENKALQEELKKKNEEIAALNNVASGLPKREELEQCKKEKDAQAGEMNAKCAAEKDAQSKELTGKCETEKGQVQGDVKAQTDRANGLDTLLALSKEATQKAETERNSANDQLAVCKTDSQKTSDELGVCVAERQKVSDEYEALLEEYTQVQAQLHDPALDLYIRAKLNTFHKLHPGLMPAFNKTMELLDGIDHRSALNSTHINIKNRLSQYLPEHAVPTAAAFLLYFVLFVPLFTATYLLISCKGCMNIKLKSVALYLHSYFMGLTGALAVSAIMLDGDPFALLQAANVGSYVMLNLIIGASFSIYCLCMFVLVVNTEFLARSFQFRMAQLMGTMLVGLLYYRLIWTPAMLDKPPLKVFQKSTVAPYLLPIISFLWNLFVETKLLGNDQIAIAHLEIEAGADEEAISVAEKKE